MLQLKMKIVVGQLFAIIYNLDLVLDGMMLLYSEMDGGSAIGKVEKIILI